MRLAGKGAIVTGGGRNICRGIVLAMAREAPRSKLGPPVRRLCSSSLQTGWSSSAVKDAAGSERAGHIRPHAVRGPSVRSSAMPNCAAAAIAWETQ
jgi:hypothetical protein